MATGIGCAPRDGGRTIEPMTEPSIRPPDDPSAAARGDAIHPTDTVGEAS
jgi:hypothetical protein